MKARLLTIIAIAFMSLIILPSCSSVRGFPPQHDINNFDIVDSKVIRGAQFNAIGLAKMASIYSLPGRPLTVINLRQPGDLWADEPAWCERAGVRYVNVPLNAVQAPSLKDIERILKIIADAPGYVFIHCQFGCDRTGTVVACYRIRVLGVANAVALNDAEVHGMSDFETAMKALIKRFK